jgi:hypothetical protein
MTSLAERLDADLRGQLRRGRPLIDELDRHAIDPTLPVDARVAMSAAARELERLTEPRPGPKAATQPPWGYGDKREVA